MIMSEIKYILYIWGENKDKAYYILDDKTGVIRIEKYVDEKWIDNLNLNVSLEKLATISDIEIQEMIDNIIQEDQEKESTKEEKIDMVLPVVDDTINEKIKQVEIVSEETKISETSNPGD